MKTVLITGASKGIGLQLATTLVTRGFRVYGTSRSLTNAPKVPFTLLELDVNNDESAQACIKRIITESGQIDVLINNAGYDLYAAAEEASETEFRAQLETNLFGAVRMSNLVAPAMRERQSGQIMQVSSIGGLIALPFNSAYAASKFALEGYSESLRHELIPFGVYVTLIEPEQVHTDTLETSVVLARTPHSAYHGASQAMANKLKASAPKEGLSIQQVVNAMVRVLETPKPRLRHPIGNLSKFLPFFKLFMPGTYESMIQNRFQPLAKVSK